MGARLYAPRVSGGDDGGPIGAPTQPTLGGGPMGAPEARGVSGGAVGGPIGAWAATVRFML
jgi:hypothetical protein